MRTKHFKWVAKLLAYIIEDRWAGASFKGAAKDEQKIFAGCFELGSLKLADNL